MAWISDNVIAAMGSRRFVCSQCGREVDNWERYLDPMTNISGLRFFCHGSIDEIEISEAMIRSSAAISRIVPFQDRQGIKKAYTPAQLELIVSSRMSKMKMPECGACFRPIDRIVRSYDESKGGFQLQFKCHGKIESRFIEARWFNEDINFAIRAIESWKPFTQVVGIEQAVATIDPLTGGLQMGATSAALGATSAARGTITFQAGVKPGLGQVIAGTDGRPIGVVLSVSDDGTAEILLNGPENPMSFMRTAELAATFDPVDPIVVNSTQGNIVKQDDLQLPKSGERQITMEDC